MKMMFGSSDATFGNINFTTLSQADIDGINWIYNPEAPTVINVTPDSGINTSPVTAEILGTNFRRNPTVTLTRTNHPDITATLVKFNSSSHITYSFPITGAEPGLWNVTVTNYDGQTGLLPNGFTVFPPQLSVTSISPSTGVNTGSVTITNLSGTLFQSGATVNLTRTGQPNITATNVQVVSSSQSSMYPVPDVLLVQSSTALPADHTGNKPGVQGNPVSLEEEMEYS